MFQYVRTRSFLIPLTLILLFSMLTAACGSPQPKLVDGKMNIVTSFYPLYDFASKIGGEHVNVINLVPAGVEPHDWSPKSRDMQNLSSSDLFLYLGAGFEGWVHDTLDSMKKDSRVTVVETSQGIQLLPGTEEEEHGHEDEQAKDEQAKDEHAHGSTDPHVWLSPVNAKQIALNIKEALVKVDSAHQADYEANFKRFADQLDELHNKYKTQLAQLPKKEIVVTHHSFGYLAKEYGLTQKALMGLSPDAEPTSKDIQQMMQFVKDNQVKYIFFEELVSDKLAKTLAKDAGVETLVLNPLEGLTEEQAKQGADYLSIMENNLNNLIKALQ
ncbi:metal ABC transporter substrate-binding protein [Paenibacillus validus]|uniref:metal ABC transporter substrate-binding protein n=1 Tax=Paenibacillus validus TaxID=44253 RepID=UPI003D2D07EB